jgi:hypothetical protein
MEPIVRLEGVLTAIFEPADLSAYALRLYPI